MLRIAADQDLGPAGRRNGRAFGFAHDTTWLLGETGTIPVRCMSDPHMFQQPEYTWDYYYKANVNKPTVLNDQGGVHTNSSLLNNVAWRLCEKGGMTLEEARAFWFAVDGSMVPHTDYAQLSALMPWVLRNQGLEKYQDALEAAIDATRLRSNDVPDSFDEDRALVTLTLTDAFKSFDFSNASMESSPLLQAVLGSLFAPKQFISQLLFTIQRGAVNEIPGTGLENVGTLDKESFPLLELLKEIPHNTAAHLAVPFPTRS